MIDLRQKIVELHPALASLVPKCAVAINDDPGGGANPMQPRRLDGMWVSVVKVDDWLGNEIRVQIAGQPQGPWVTTQEIIAPTRTANGQTNTYAAHLLPWRSATGNLMIALSNKPCIIRIPSTSWFRLSDTVTSKKGANRTISDLTIC